MILYVKFVFTIIKRSYNEFSLFTIKLGGE